MATLLQQALGSMPHQLPHRPPGGRLQQQQQKQDGRLQLREALAGLQQPDLQEQAMFACETLVRQSTDSPLSCLKELFRMDSSCPGSARRLRYRLAAQALSRLALPPLTLPPRPWGGGALLFVRDQLVLRAGAEDHAAAAEELASLAGQLAAAAVDAYRLGQYAELLGRGSGGGDDAVAAAAAAQAKADLSHDWISRVLVTPLLQAGCRGPSRARGANACRLVHAVLCALQRWGGTSAVLHAGVDALRQLLQMTAAGGGGGGALLPLSAPEVLLPLQASVALLGPRLRPAALHAILQLCVQAMQRSEWQVRKAAADTLVALVDAVVVAGPVDPAAAGAAVSGGGGGGVAALECIATEAAAAVEQHLRYDRIPQVRQSAAAVLRRLRHSRQAPGQRDQRQTHPQEAAASDPAGAAAEAEANAPVASPSQGLAASRSALKALIVQRRQQLKQAGREQPAVEVYGGGGGDGVHASSAAGSMAPPAAAALFGSKHGGGGGGSSVGSAAADDEEEDEYWGGALLHGEAAGEGAGRIRAWVGNDVSEQRQPEQRQMEEEAVATQCVHYIDRPEFSLRLQVAPPEAELRLAGGGGGTEPAALHSVRFWVQQQQGDAGAGADCPPGSVGVEFTVVASSSSPEGGAAPPPPPTLHRYWAAPGGGRLHQEHRSAVEPAAAAAVAAAAPAPLPAASAAAVAAAAAAGVIQQAAPAAAAADAALPDASPPGSPPMQQPALAAAAAAPAESPLASLAIAALPSFSPDKPPAAACSPAADVVTGGASQRPAATPTAGAAGALGATPSSAPAPASVSAVGNGSSSPAPERRPTNEAGSRAGSPPLQQQQQQEERLEGPPAAAADAAAADGSPVHSRIRGPGPLTTMVARAVSKLQQLQVLQEELHLQQQPQLPPALDQPSGHAGHEDSSSQQQQQALPSPGLRRSLGPTLCAITESPEGSGGGGGGGAVAAAVAAAGAAGFGRYSSQPIPQQQWQQQPPASVATASASALPAARRGAPHSEEMGRLRRLQEQLESSMGEIQRRIGDSPQQQGPRRSVAAAAAAQASSAAASPDARASGGLAVGGALPDGAAWLSSSAEFVAATALEGQKRGGGLQHDSWGSAQQPLQQASLEAEDSEESGDLRQHSPLPPPPLRPLDNPLFGSSLPGSADLSNLLPLGSAAAAAAAAAAPAGPQQWEREEPEVRRRLPHPPPAPLQLPHLPGTPPPLMMLHSPQLSGSLMHSLGSGFGGTQGQDWEAEVAQFLRGSLAASQQQPLARRRREGQQQQQPGGSRVLTPTSTGGQLSYLAGRPDSPAAMLPSSLTAAAAAATAAAAAVPRLPLPSPPQPQLLPHSPVLSGSLDLAAILGDDNSRPPSPTPRLAALRGPTAAAAPPPPEDELAALTRQQQKQQWEREVEAEASASSSPSASSAAVSIDGAGWLGGGGGGSRCGSPPLMLPARAESPMLPGLPGISRRHALLLQSAVGRMPGNPGEGADAADLQAALTNILERQTAEVQAHYRGEAARQVARVRRRLESEGGQQGGGGGGDPAAALEVALAVEGARAEAAAQEAVRADLGGFLQQELPRLAEVLSSSELLMKCFAAADAAASASEGEEV